MRRDGVIQGHPGRHESSVYGAFASKSRTGLPRCIVLAIWADVARILLVLRAAVCSKAGDQAVYSVVLRHQSKQSAEESCHRFPSSVQ